MRRFRRRARSSRLTPYSRVWTRLKRRSRRPGSSTRRTSRCCRISLLVSLSTPATHKPSPWALSGIGSSASSSTAGRCTAVRGNPVTPEEKKDRAAEIAEVLSNHGRWKTHGRSITIDNLRDLGLLVTDYGEQAELADAIRRYYVLLRMTFDTNIYKLFETTTSQIMRFENVAPVAGQAQQDAKNAFLEMPCKKCGTKLKVQASLGEPSPIEPGCQPFPEDDRLQCSACGVEINLAQARRQVEAQSKKRVLTPLSAQLQ